MLCNSELLLATFGFVLLRLCPPCVHRKGLCIRICLMDVPFRRTPRKHITYTKQTTTCYYHVMQDLTVEVPGHHVLCKILRRM